MKFKDSENISVIFLLGLFFNFNKKIDFAKITRHSSAFWVTSSPIGDPQGTAFETRFAHVPSSKLRECATAVFKRSFVVRFSNECLLNTLNMWSVQQLFFQG